MPVQRRQYKPQFPDLEATGCAPFVQFAQIDALKLCSFQVNQAWKHIQWARFNLPRGCLTADGSIVGYKIYCVSSDATDRAAPWQHNPAASPRWPAAARSGG